MSINTYEDVKKDTSVVNIKNEIDINKINDINQISDFQNAVKHIDIIENQNVNSDKHIDKQENDFDISIFENAKKENILAFLDLPYCHKHKVVGNKCWRCQANALHTAKTFLFLENKTCRYVNLANTKKSIRIEPDIKHILLEDCQKTKLANKHISLLPRRKIELADILNLNDINDIKDFILLHIVKKKK
jgi:hypothetical protein